MKDKDDYLLLSQLTQAAYCLRRSALVINEQLWQESADTAKGRLEHEKAHEKRVEHHGDLVKLYEHTVWSDTLEIYGKCDCIEAAADEQGVLIPACDLPVKLYPVEYKHGKVREEPEYELQLCAQAMCLEEMYHTEIPEGALYYTSSHRRLTVSLDQPLREKVKEMILSLRELRKSAVLPPAEYSAKCDKCSLKEQCMPCLSRSAKAYCRKIEEEAERKAEEI